MCPGCGNKYEYTIIPILICTYHYDCTLILKLHLLFSLYLGTYRKIMINVNINAFFDNKFVVRYLCTLKTRL